MGDGQRTHTHTKRRVTHPRRTGLLAAGAIEPDKPASHTSGRVCQDKVASSAPLSFGAMKYGIAIRTLLERQWIDERRITFVELEADQKQSPS